MAGKVNQPIVADRLAWIERMVVRVRALPLGSKGVLDARNAHLMALLARYRNRLVHFYHEISPGVGYHLHTGYRRHPVFGRNIAPLGYRSDRPT